MSKETATEAPKRAPRSRERGPDRAPRKTRDLKAEALTQDGDAKPTSPWKRESLEIGAAYLVRLLWLLSSGVSFIIGGKLAPLSDDDVKAGAVEALPIVRRFPALVVALMLAGLPLWLMRTIAAKFTWRPKPVEKKKEESNTPPRAESNTAPAPGGGATVTHINAPKGA